MEDIIIIDEESYLAINGASKYGIGDAALHKNIPEGKIRKRILERQNELDRELIEKRDILREEYYNKIKIGEIRDTNRMEKLIIIANGHPDIEATKAAKRILNKLGKDL